jgi:predicted amidohydrolase
MIDPDNTEAWFLAAVVASKEQNKKRALDYLQSAVAKGYNDRARLNLTPEFNFLLSEPLYNEIINKIRN